MMIKPGRLAAITTVVGWAALFTFHLWRSYTPATTATDVVLASPVAADLNQRGVFYRGARIGFVRERLVTFEGGLRAEQEGRFVLNVMGQKRSVEIAGDARLGSQGELKEFSYRLMTSSGRSPFQTELSGSVEGGQLKLTIRSGRRTRSETRDLRRPIVLPVHLYYSLASQGLEPGTTYRVPLFDPMTLTEDEAEIAVIEPEIVRWGGREEEAFRLRNRFAGLTTTAWVNERGQILKEETPLGWTLIKEEPESGLQARTSDAIPEMIAASAVVARGRVDRPEELRRARLRLNGFPPLSEDATGGRQRVSGNEVLIEVESLPPPLTGELTRDEQREYLRADAFIQADDPAIRALALRLVEGLPPLDAARSLSDWVYENLRKTPTLSIPSAAEVLEQRAGDCNEHTVLFTALARAAGIPTRVSTGLAWSSGRFYYHAWPEVWLGSWLAVDPTFGQFPADPLHLRLLTGGLEQQYEVLNFMGRSASIEIVEAR